MRRLAIALTAAVSPLGASASVASAAECVSGTTTWTNPAGGNWDDDANWSSGRPSAGCDALITLIGTYTVEVGNADRFFAHGVTARSIVLGGSTGTQTL